jgi:hypothetical protein
MPFAMVSLPKFLRFTTVVTLELDLLPGLSGYRLMPALNSMILYGDHLTGKIVWQPSKHNSLLVPVGSLIKCIKLRRLCQNCQRYKARPVRRMALPGH